MDEPDEALSYDSTSDATDEDEQGALGDIEPQPEHGKSLSSYIDDKEEAETAKGEAKEAKSYNYTSHSSDLDEHDNPEGEHFTSFSSTTDGQEEEDMQTSAKSPSSEMEDQKELAEEKVKSIRSNVEIKDEVIHEKISCHSSFLSNGLFLLWTAELYCDCILVVDDKEIKCHSCVIASFSPLLQIKLNSSQHRTRLEYDKHMVVLDLTEVIIYADLEPLIRYMYTGELSLKSSQMNNILKSAQFLGLKEIQQFCLIWIAHNLTTCIKEPFHSTTKTVNKSPQTKLNVSKVKTEISSRNVKETDIGISPLKDASEKSDEFDFQDYIDILNSWQRAVTDDTITNITESLRHSVNADKKTSVTQHGKKRKITSVETSSGEILNPTNRRGKAINSARQRKAANMTKQQPHRHTKAVSGNKGKTNSSVGFIKPMDLLYVNFDEQNSHGSDSTKSPDKLATAKGKVESQERIVVVLPTAPVKYDKVKNVRKATRPRRFIKKPCKRVNKDDGTELNDGSCSRGTSGVEEAKITLDEEITVDVDGESYTVPRTLDDMGRMTVRCPKCDRPFGKLNSFRQHVSNHANNKLCTCHVCGQAFMRPSDLTRHIRNHSGIKCSHCTFTTNSPKMFTIHSEQEHGIMKPFVCTHEGCNFATTRQHQLDSHMAVHADIKPHLCPHCSKTFAHKGGLESHLKSCLQARDLLCDLCGKAFNHLGSLKSHRRVHLGDKPYLCTDCPSRFSDHRNLKRHTLIHLKIYPYSCEICDKRFRHTNSLKTHMQSQHKIDSHDVSHQTAEMDTWRANMDVVMEAAERMACSTFGPVIGTETRSELQGVRETEGKDLNSISPPFSTDLKREYRRKESDLSSYQKLPKTLNVAPDQGQPYNIKQPETEHQDENPGNYSQLPSFHQKLSQVSADSRRLPPASPPANDSLRSLDSYQHNISMAHLQPPMTSGYSAACLAPFSPFVSSELHSFYSSQGLIPGGPMDVHSHSSIIPSSNRPPVPYPQLHEYPMANIWKSAHDT